MKRVDMDELIIVHSGETWLHQVPPCSRAMIRFLERNEDLVTWVQVCQHAQVTSTGVRLLCAACPWSWQGRKVRIRLLMTFILINFVRVMPVDSQQLANYKVGNIIALGPKDLEMIFCVTLSNPE